MDSIVFSASGFKGFVQLGCLCEIQRRGLVGAGTTFIGCSAGSIVATLGALGADASTVPDAIARLDIDLENLVSGNVTNLMRRYGGDDGARLFDAVRCLLKVYWGHGRMTFGALRERTGRELLITATCLSDASAVTFGPSTHPGMLVLDAIRMSCSVPFVLMPVEYENKLYVDGALTSYFPHSLATGNDKIGVCILGAHGGSGFFNYVAQLLSCGLKIDKNVGWALYMEEEDNGHFMLQSGGLTPAEMRRMFVSGIGRMARHLDMLAKKKQ